MSASERRAEIMRILVGRRKCYLSDLAQELGVSKRTILSQEQIRTLRELNSYADEQQKKIVQQIISAYGTNTYCSVWKTKE